MLYNFFQSFVMQQTIITHRQHKVFVRAKPWTRLQMNELQHLQQRYKGNKIIAFWTSIVNHIWGSVCG